MDVSPFVLPGLIIFCTFLAGVGILFMCIPLAQKNMRGARDILVSLRGRTFLMLMFSWSTVIVSLFSFTALETVDQFPETAFNQPYIEIVRYKWVARIF